MTIKIELLDSVIEAFRNSDRELFEEISDEEIRYGITAALEAMVQDGTAQEGLGWEFKNGKFGAYGREVIKEGDLVFPALIIRLGEKP